MKQKEKETLEKAILKGEIRGKIDASEILNEPPDICSWTYKWGVVLTRDQAKLFLSLLSSTMRTEEEERKKLKEWESSLYWVLNEKGEKK